MKTTTKKNVIIVLLMCVIACALCLAVNTSKTDRFNGNYDAGKFVAYAYSEAEGNVLGETKYQVSSNKSGDDNYLLIVTQLKNPEYVYEIGYDFGETYTVQAGDKASTDTYYTSITTNNDKTLNASHIFADGNEGDAMIVWEVKYNKSATYSYTAYAKVGFIDNDVLYSYNEPRTDEGTKSATAFYTVTVTVDSASSAYGDIDVTEITEVPHGATVSVVGNALTVNGTTVTATPKDDTAEFDYEFDGFLGQPAKITENTEVTVYFTRETRTYLITFLNDDGSTLQSGNVAYGTTPSYASTPASGTQTIFVKNFNGWDNTIVPVSAAATYTATYVNGGGAELVRLDKFDEYWFNTMYVVDSSTGETAINTGAEFDFRNGFIWSADSVGISNALIAEAKAAGYNYLEIAFNGSGWLSVDTTAGTNYFATNQSYTDMVEGKEYMVIDVSGISANTGYTMLAKTNMGAIRLYNAKFVNKPVTENVNFGSAWYSYDGNSLLKVYNPETGNTVSFYADNNGNGGFKWGQGSFTYSQPYLGVNVSRDSGYSSDCGTIGNYSTNGLAGMYIRAWAVRQAINLGFTKMIVTCVVNGTDTVYYWANAREWETNITTQGATATVSNHLVTVEIDISEFTNGSYNWCSLPFVNNGYIMYKNIHFTN